MASVSETHAAAMSDLRIRTYLRALAALCVEVADKPWLLPSFVLIVMMVPKTLAQIVREQRIAA